jgi:hypothetical protein
MKFLKDCHASDSPKVTCLVVVDLFHHQVDRLHRCAPIQTPPQGVATLHDVSSVTVLLTLHAAALQVVKLWERNAQTTQGPAAVCSVLMASVSSRM